MKISLAIVLCLALAMTSAFRIRQGNGMGQLMADMQQGIQDGNQALTDTEGLLNDATEATEGMANQFIGQGLNAAGQFTGAAVGGTRLQQGVGDAVNVATTDGTTLTNDAVELTTDATAVFNDLNNQFMNTATNFMGGMMGGMPGGATGGARLQQGNLAQDIGTLNQATLGAVQDGETAFNDALEQTELLTNNALQGFENAMGAQGATVNAPARFQQATQTDVADDTTAVTNDFAGLTNDGIALTNDLLQQTNAAFAQLMGGMTGAAPGGN